jgi:octopine/nopaline transport system ATP-binding protein
MGEAAAAPILAVTSLHKHYGATEVLKGVSLSVRLREVVAIIGASGSGKSTFLRCINLLETPSAGRLDFDGLSIDFSKPERVWRRGLNLRRLRTRIGMVFQSYNLWPHKTVLENVTEGPIRVKGIARAEAVELAGELLARIGLDEKRHSYPSRLSGGQQQRVAIARALAMEPDVMLFDEATSALDPELIGGILDEIRKLAEAGMTMIVVTHEMGFAREVGDRLIFMDEGRIVEQGPAREVLASPQSPRTQSFLRAIL